MFDIYALLILFASSLFAGDMILIASRSVSKVKPDWKTAVLAGGAGMLFAEMTSFISWQFASVLAGFLGEGAASWISVGISACAGALVATWIFYKRFGIVYWKAYSRSLVALLPAFILYSILLGLYTGMMAK